MGEAQNRDVGYTLRLAFHRGLWTRLSPLFPLIQRQILDAIHHILWLQYFAHQFQI